MRKRACFLVAVIATCLFSFTSFAQTSVSGTVKNNTTGEAVPAVSVTVKGTTQGTFTDQDGNFTLKVAKLPVTLVFSSVGYDSHEATVSSAAASVDVSFKPNPLLGQEIVVSANRTPQRILESPVTVERMSSSAIKSAAAPNYYDAIANLKGVDMHTASLTFRTVTTRGFTGSGNVKLNQLTDGMDNQAPGLNFSVGSIIGPNELDVDNVELLAGASSALYGSGGINGTLLINSKNPFKYQGLSFNIKQGVNHTDGKQRDPAPYYDWALRWAKAFNNKFAFKLSASMVSAQDWQADDYRNKDQFGVLSKVVAGDRQSDPNFNGVNIYGDEASANMQAIAGAAIQRGRVAVVTQALQLQGRVATQAEVNAFMSDPQRLAAMNAALSTNPQVAPFFLGMQTGAIPNRNVSRTGYLERDLVDYNTLNVKLNGSLHYKITDDIEASWHSYFGTGTTVYTGADRYSLRNLKMSQHKLEFKGRNWMVRGYTTQEDAGGSYNASALGAYINDSWKANETWFGEYVGNYAGAILQGGGNVTPEMAHALARSRADVGRLLPGTSGFETTKAKVMATPIKNKGALFLDKSDLYAAEGQLNVSDAFEFNHIIEVLAGVQWKQYVMNSQGTLFADTLGVLKINEIGGYLQLKKTLFDDKLTLTASGRYDKQTNFEGKFTPRVTGVYRVAKDNFIRLSYQNAYRFPTNQNQYISLVTGAGTLIGALPEFQTFYKLNSTHPGYTPASIAEYRRTGSQADLVQAQYREVKPETVNSYELGYKGVLGGNLMFDAYVYYSQYKNMLGAVALGQSGDAQGAVTALLNPLTTRSISYTQNTEGTVNVTGWGISAEYKLVKNYFVYGNVFSDVMGDLPHPEYVSFFNAPKYRFNLGVRNDNVANGVGFNVVYKYQGKSYYEGTFISGDLPSFSTLDAQITYRVPKTKSTFRIGGTNIANKYYRTGFGSPYVGGLYYVSYGYNL